MRKNIPPDDFIIVYQKNIEKANKDAKKNSDKIIADAEKKAAEIIAVAEKNSDKITADIIRRLEVRYA